MEKEYKYPERDTFAIINGYIFEKNINFELKNNSIFFARREDVLIPKGRYKIFNTKRLRGSIGVTILNLELQGEYDITSHALARWYENGDLKFYKS